MSLLRSIPANVLQNYIWLNYSGVIILDVILTCVPSIRLDY